MTDTEFALKETHEPMANGHTGEGNGVEPGVPEASMEFHILMAYAKRRRPSDKRLRSQPSITTPASTTEANHDSQNTPPKKKKKKWYHKLPCLRPMIEDPDPQSDQSDDDESRPQFAMIEAESESDKVAGKLTQISTTVPFLDGELEADCGEDKLVQEIANLLRDSGDDLNEKIKNDKDLHDRFLAASFNYSLFSRITTAFLGKLNLSSTPVQNEEAKIAMTCEVATRLSTMDPDPMHQTMVFGSRYLHDNFSTWFKQHGGGDQSYKQDEEQD
ncbi:apoptosis facilitator Bcl-2-like protein 14 [Sardina pilchardus]|uniref:apoptosis facilitator Bcl-2-like protein 14 n=1 Tax=Sardina pilchardus TaxID=27697 RepID=UPI002E0F6378